MSDVIGAIAIVLLGWIAYELTEISIALNDRNKSKQEKP